MDGEQVLISVCLTSRHIDAIEDPNHSSLYSNSSFNSKLEDLGSLHLPKISRFEGSTQCLRIFNSLNLKIIICLFVLYSMNCIFLFFCFFKEYKDSFNKKKENQKVRQILARKYRTKDGGKSLRTFYRDVLELRRN